MFLDGGPLSMKEALLQEIRSQLAFRLERLNAAAKEAHSAATDPDSKAENKYDTRNLEASYLASGQSRHAEEIEAAIKTFERIRLPEFSRDAPIDAGALVHVSLEDEKLWFLLVPASGGLEFTHEGQKITLLTPSSPLYQRLSGLRKGDSLNQPSLLILDVR